MISEFLRIKNLAPEFNEYFELWASYKTSQPPFNRKKGWINKTESLKGLKKGKLHVKLPDIAQQILKP